MAGIIGSLIGLATNSMNNKAQRELYEQQYRDSLSFYRMQQSDNLKLWSMNNEYNTPAGQADRMRDAGINPDLAYQQIDTGNSSSPAEGATPEVPRQEYTPLSAEVFANLPGILEGIERIQGIAMNELELSGAINNDIQSLLMGEFSPEELQAFRAGGLNDAILSNKFWDQIPGLGPRRKRFYESRIRSVMNSPEFLQRYDKARSGSAESLFGLEKITGNPLFSKDGTVSDALSDFLKLINDTDISVLNARKSEADYNSEYNNLLDPEIAAGQQNETRDYEAQRKQFEKRFYDYLNADKSDTTKAGYLVRQFLGGLYLILAQMNGIGSFSRSSSSGPKGTTSTTSIGF